MWNKNSEYGPLIYHSFPLLNRQAPYLPFPSYPIPHLTTPALVCLFQIKRFPTYVLLQICPMQFEIPILFTIANGNFIIRFRRNRGIRSNLRKTVHIPKSIRQSWKVDQTSHPKVFTHKNQKFSRSSTLDLFPSKGVHSEVAGCALFSICFIEWIGEPHRIKAMNKSSPGSLR